MNLLLDAFWRAAAYCLHPRVIGLSLLPLVLMVGGSFALGYFFWDGAVAAMRGLLERWDLLTDVLNWVSGQKADELRAVFAPMLVLLLVTPLMVTVALFVVALTMTPAVVALVAGRRFQDLERRRGGSLLGSVLWSLGSVLAAMLALLLSMPLWLIPPLVLVLPPLIWGWLTYRVFAYDALAEHASRAERALLLQRHRMHLLLIGVTSGFLGAAPSLLWASGAMFIALAPLLVPVAVWVYTLMFAFASAWFAHYLLAALQTLRAEEAAAMAIDVTPGVARAASARGDGVVDVAARVLREDERPPHAASDEAGVVDPAQRAAGSASDTAASDAGPGGDRKGDTR